MRLSAEEEAEAQRVAAARWAALVIALNRGPESQAITSSPERIDRLFPVVGLPLHIIGAGSLALIILGLRPGLDGALYVTALTTGVVFAGYTMLALSFSQKPTGATKALSGPPGSVGGDQTTQGTSTAA